MIDFTTLCCLVAAGFCGYFGWGTGGPRFGVAFAMIAWGMTSLFAAASGDAIEILPLTGHGLASSCAVGFVGFSLLFGVPYGVGALVWIYAIGPPVVEYLFGPMAGGYVTHVRDAAIVPWLGAVIVGALSSVGVPIPGCKCGC